MRTAQDEPPQKPGARDQHGLTPIENKMSYRVKTESQEADWWASAEGRAFLKKNSKDSRTSGVEPAGSRLVARLRRESTQIAPPAAS